MLRACEEVLACAAAPGVACGRLGVSAQYVQIYNDEVTDLMGGGRVQPRDTGRGGAAAFVLHGARQLPLNSLDDALAMLQAAEALVGGRVRLGG